MACLCVSLKASIRSLITDCHARDRGDRVGSPLACPSERQISLRRSDQFGNKTTTRSPTGAFPPPSPSPSTERAWRHEAKSHETKSILVIREGNRKPDVRNASCRFIVSRRSVSIVDIASFPIQSPLWIFLKDISRSRLKELQRYSRDTTDTRTLSRGRKGSGRRLLQLSCFYDRYSES